MDIIIDEGLESECTIHYAGSTGTRHGHDYDTFHVGGQAEEILRGLPGLFRAVRSALASDDTLMELNNALEGCLGEQTE